MKKNKKEKIKEERFWQNLFYFSVPRHLKEVPSHLERVNFRICGVDDDGLLWLTQQVKSIDQLDLDETEVTNKGIHHLMKLDRLRELRLKDCTDIDDGCLEFLCNIPTIELLHLGGTPVTLNGLLKIGSLKNLRMLLISASGDAASELSAIAALLPQDCEFVVNHQLYKSE